MSEFYDDCTELFANTSEGSTANYVHIEEDSQYFESLDQIARMLEMLKGRITAGKFVYANYQNGYRLVHTQQIHEDIRDIIVGIRNTEKRFKLTELGT
jgi:hypothetical protein